MREPAGSMLRPSTPTASPEAMAAWMPAVLALLSRLCLQT
jgi:hypothetical protein